MCMKSGKNMPPASPTPADSAPALSARRSGPRNLLRRLLPILIPLLLIAVVWQIRDMWVVRSVGGVYVLPDGASYVVLKRGVVPAVRVPEGFIWTDRGQFGAPLRVSSLRAILLGNELILKQKLVSDITRGTDGIGKLRDYLTLYLRPSHSVPGDWDLVSANLDKKANALYSDYPKPMGGYATDLLGPKDPNASFWSSLDRRIKRGIYEWVRPLFTGVLDPAAAPIPSFLHRVKDPRVARYFNNQLHQVDSKEDLDALRQLARPDAGASWLRYQATGTDKVGRASRLPTSPGRGSESAWRDPVATGSENGRRDAHPTLSAAPMMEPSRGTRSGVKMRPPDAPDVYLALHHLTLETRIGSVEDAERIWERWSGAHGKQGRGMARRTAEKARRILLSAQWRKKYPELAREWDSWEKSVTWSTDTPPRHFTPPVSERSLDAYLALLRKVSKTDSPLFPVKRLVPPCLKSPGDSPRFLEIQILSKVARAEAVLSLFKGDRAQSLETLAGSYWIGGSQNSGETPIERLIGIAVRTIAAVGLEMHALNGCETAEDLKAAWDMLEHLANLPGQETDSSRRALMDTPLVGEMKLSGSVNPNFREFEVRQKSGDARFAILRTAVAARYHLLTAGAFPKSPAEFGPLLPGGPLADCFATSAPLRFVAKPDGFYIYTIGPDERDDAGAIAYDPTNGSASRGDLAMRVPREREYPFPACGVRVNTAAELLKMFPNGLPPDPFADTRGRPFSIIASSEADWESCALPGARKGAAAPGGAASAQDSPPAAASGLPATPSRGADAPTSSVIVFSFGPDTDESEHVLLRRLTGEDVFTTYSIPAARLQLVYPPNASRVPTPLPRAGTMPELAATTAIQADLAAARYGSPGGGYPLSNPNASPFRQPAYDPTNGSTSKGNLYLEIPRP